MKHSDQAWRVEQRGIEAVELGERYGKTRELFAIWFAANIGFLGLLYGAIIVSYQLTWWQGILAELCGSASFLLVGVLGVFGKNVGEPMLIVTRRPFGSIGTLLPALVGWINLLGWETVIWVTATDAILALSHDVLKIQINPTGTTILFLLLGASVFVVALYGHATIVYVQKWISVIFGVATLAILLELVLHLQAHLTGGAHPVSWLGGFVPAVSLIVLGTGMSWVTTASDYTRYMPASTSSWRIVSRTWLGAAIPLIVIMVTGMLLTPSLPSLATTANPLELLGASLPQGWLLVFWITAAVGLLTENILAIYSSGLTLQAMHVRIARPYTAIVEYVLTGSIGLYFLLSNSPFLATLQSFLSVVGSTLAPYAGIMLIEGMFTHFGQKKRSVRAFGFPALFAWLLGILVDLAFTSTPFGNGLWADTVVGTAQLGFLFGMVVSMVVYGLWLLGRRR